MNFDIDNIVTIEFSIKTSYTAKDGDDVEALHRVATDANVKKLLAECLKATLKKFPSDISSVPVFELSEKYSDRDRFQLPTETYPAAAQIINESPNNNVYLSNIPKNSIQYYRVDFHDAAGKKITAIRRASYFKSLLKNKNRLVQFYDDALRAVDDELFKLDNDFDFIENEGNIYVIRPRVLESMVLPDNEVTQAALERIEELKSAMPFVDFESVQGAVKLYKKAARLVFAVSQRDDMQDIDKDRVIYYAGQSNIQIKLSDNGVLTPQEGSEVDFLEMLDRRIYNVEFIEGETEYYRADSRSRRA